MRSQPGFGYAVITLISQNQCIEGSFSAISVIIFEQQHAGHRPFFFSLSPTKLSFVGNSFVVMWALAGFARGRD